MSAEPYNPTDVLDKIIDDVALVTGEIYVLRNKTNGMEYVGQTVSHRLNHKRYRPFGHMGRLRDHISVAMCNTKKMQCRYLNAAIRRHGQDAFDVELLERCAVADLDARESHHIESRGTLFPAGYNLTLGGKTTRYVQHPDMEATIAAEDRPTTHVIHDRKAPRSAATKARIGAGLKKYAETHDDVHEKLSKKAQEQHLERKYEIGMPYEIDLENLDKHIVERKYDIAVKLELKPYGKIVTFHKNDDVAVTRQRAEAYCQELVKRQRENVLQRFQTAGTP